MTIEEAQQKYKEESRKYGEINIYTASNKEISQVWQNLINAMYEVHQVIENESKEENNKMEETKKNKIGTAKSSEQEYIDLVLEFMRMTFENKIKGFEVKNAKNGKLKIIIK